MVDVALTWNDYGADIELTADDLRQGNDITTAILTSLFSDLRATDEQLPQGEQDHRGWWSDFTGTFGSLLWLLEREKTTEGTAEKARQFCLDALNWLISEAIASSIEIETKLAKPFGLMISIKVSRGLNKKYDYAWQNISNFDYTFNKTTVRIDFD